MDEEKKNDQTNLSADQNRGTDADVNQNNADRTDFYEDADSELMGEKKGLKNGPKIFYNSQQARNERKLDPEELQQLQKQWQRYEVPEDELPTVLPDYFFAGFWLRLFAFTLDLMCIAAVRNSSLGLIYRLLGLEWQGGFLGVYSLVGIGIYLAYFTLLTRYNHGQTVGKMVFGLRVISLAGDELTWSQVLTREVCCRFVMMKFPLNLGYLPAAFTGKKQHVGDYFAETGVVTINLIKAFNKELA